MHGATQDDVDAKANGQEHQLQDDDTRYNELFQLCHRQISNTSNAARTALSCRIHNSGAASACKIVAVVEMHPARGGSGGTTRALVVQHCRSRQGDASIQRLEKPCRRRIPEGSVVEEPANHRRVDRLNPRIVVGREVTTSLSLVLDAVDVDVECPRDNVPV